MTEEESQEKSASKMNRKVLAGRLKIKVTNVITVASWATLFELQDVPERVKQDRKYGYVDSDEQQDKTWARIGIEGTLFILTSPPTKVIKHWRYILVVLNRTNTIDFALEITQHGTTSNDDRAPDLLYLKGHAWPIEASKDFFYGVEEPHYGSSEFGIWIYSDGSSSSQPDAVLHKLNFCQMLCTIQRDGINDGETNLYQGLPYDYHGFNLRQLRVMIKSAFNPLDHYDKPASVRRTHDRAAGVIIPAPRTPPGAATSGQSSPLYPSSGSSYDSYLSVPSSPLSSLPPPLRPPPSPPSPPPANAPPLPQGAEADSQRLLTMFNDAAAAAKPSSLAVRR